jgi:hypothetical protein
MKNVILLLLFAISLNGFSQTKIGFKAGVGLATISTNDDELNAEKTSFFTPQFGIVLQSKISSSLSVQTQLLYSNKGTAESHDDHKDYVKFSSLDLPVQFLFESKNGLVLGAGPNVGFNLSAHHLHDDEKEAIEIGKESGEVKRLDLGLNITGGYQSKKGWAVNVTYLRGLTNLQNVPNFTWNNNLLSFGFTYFLKGTKKK